MACGQSGPITPVVDDTHRAVELPESQADWDSDEVNAAADIEAETEDEPLDATDEVAEVGPEEVVDDIEETTEGPVCQDANCAVLLKPNSCERARCEKDVCILEPDPSQDTKPCDDGDPCTVLTYCDAGTCSGGKPNPCDDLTLGPCERATCDIDQGGCAVIWRDNGVGCDDDDTCTTAEQCINGLCVGESLCDNGNVCDGIETCEQGTCSPGIPLACDDGDLCTGQESCHPVWGCTLGNPLVCDDGQACNGQETCDPIYGCLPGAALVCDDLDPCNGLESCDEANGCQGGAPMDCGLSACSSGAGCWLTCTIDAHCAPEAHCDILDTDQDGDAMECLADFDDGQDCVYASQCESDYCEGGLCCAGGQCCLEDEDCPVSGDVIDQFQTSLDLSSGIARAVLAPGIGGLQTFTATASGPLGRFSIRVTVPQGQIETLNVQLYRAPPPSQPGAEQLANKTVMLSATTESPQQVDIIFDPPPSLISGELYGVAIIGDSSNASCGLACPTIWHGAEGDPYPFGQVYRSYDGGQGWDTSPFGEDLWFEVTVGAQQCVASVCVE